MTHVKLKCTMEFFPLCHPRYGVIICMTKSFSSYVIVKGKRYFYSQSLYTFHDINGVFVSCYQYGNQSNVRLQN